MATVRREKEELNKNHSLVMSERDNVHKEIDMLTERLADSNSKVRFKSSFYTFTLARLCQRTWG